MAERRHNLKSVRLAREAAEWFVQLRDNDLGIKERRRYLRWLKRSPRHAAEMLKLLRLAHWLHNAEIEGVVKLERGPHGR